VRDPLTRLDDILQAIANIEGQSPLTRKRFYEDEYLQSWVLRHIQNIGEAVQHLPDQWLKELPQIPWGDIIGMRNRIVHGYFNIRLDAVWDAVENGIPTLKRGVQALLALHSSRS
jgi:uncharacterized protein with HEPN domain